MHRASPFSYQCNQCGRCCHNQVITLSPVDVIAIARASGLSTGDAVARYTIRRGSLLRFDANGCAALDGVRCSIHRGRPLACRLYPLGLDRDGTDRFIRLEPASGSTGIYGAAATIGEFLIAQGVDNQLDLNELYLSLVATMRDRIAHLIDFETIEPRGFWRRAVAEALRETDFNPNPIIDALFDADSAGCRRASVAATVDMHLAALSVQAQSATDATGIAAAAVLLAVSLGYSPSEAIAARDT